MPLGLLVARIGRSVRQLVAAQVEPLGLSTQEFWTLVAVAEHRSASQAELAARQHVDEATTCRVVRALGDAGLLAAVRDPDDRRRVRLELTAEGAALTARLLPIARGIRATLDSALGPAEREATRVALGKVLARVEGLIATPAPAVLPPVPSPRPASRRRRDPAAVATAAHARAGAVGRHRSPAPRGTP